MKKIRILLLFLALCGGAKAQSFLYVRNHTDFLVRITLYGENPLACGIPPCDASLVGNLFIVSNASYPTTCYPASCFGIDPCLFPWNASSSDACALANYCYGGTLSADFRWSKADIVVLACSYSASISGSGCAGAPATSIPGGCIGTIYATWTAGTLPGDVVIDIYQ
jgi:hypothetical protein